jgi:hypothetical protein
MAAAPSHCALLLIADIQSVDLDRMSSEAVLSDLQNRVRKILWRQVDI